MCEQDQHQEHEQDPQTDRQELEALKHRVSVLEEQLRAVDELALTAAEAAIRVLRARGRKPRRGCANRANRAKGSSDAPTESPEALLELARRHHV